MNKIIALSRRKAMEFTSDVPWAAIQIATNQDWEHPKLNKCQLVDTLKLYFDDVDGVTQWGGQSPMDPHFDYTFFTDKMALTIWNFVISVKDKVDILLVHCEAGISRSSGIAGGLSKCLFDDDEIFFKKPYSPNMLVYRKILECHQRNVH
jgi:predicted protein tyrosine phosphatase